VYEEALAPWGAVEPETNNYKIIIIINIIALLISCYAGNSMVVYK
jgi:hypothetical protein